MTEHKSEQLKSQSIFKSRTFHFIIIICITLALGLSLAKSTYYINFWPTDSHSPYRPAAQRLFDQPYISQIHDLVGFKLIMRGKETLILGIAIMQRLLNDVQTLYPNVLLLIVSVSISSILFFIIFNNLFGLTEGWVAFLLYACCCLPYQYVLHGAHPPLVMMNCLLAIFFILHADINRILYVFAGLAIGFMLFSSPTSPVYLPYVGGFLIYWMFIREQRDRVFHVIINSVLILVGILAVFLYFTLPRPLEYIEAFKNFLAFSQRGNDFTIWRQKFSPYFTVPDGFRGAGLEWIVKYFFKALPVMFVCYGMSLLILLFKGIKKPLLFLVIILSLSTPICVEIVQVAQFGRNYFSWILGMIFAIVMAIFFIKQRIVKSSAILKVGGMASLVLLMSGYVVSNGYAFFNDIYPSRMTTTHLYEWLRTNDVRKLYTYKEHPRVHLLNFLVNPKIKGQMNFGPIESIAQVNEGYIMIPPPSGKTIWDGCKEPGFDGDYMFKTLYASGELDKYVVAKFKSFSSSWYWTQEQEICTYRDVILGQITKEDRDMGYVWILDAAKLHNDWVLRVLNRR